MPIFGSIHRHAHASIRLLALLLACLVLFLSTEQPLQAHEDAISSPSVIATSAARSHYEFDPRGEFTPDGPNGRTVTIKGDPIRPGTYFEGGAMDQLRFANKAAERQWNKQQAQVHLIPGPTHILRDVHVIDPKHLPPGWGPFGPLAPLPKVSISRTTASGTLDNVQGIQAHRRSGFYANLGTVGNVRAVPGRVAAAAVGTPSFTITPSLTTISRTRTITIQGTGTAWTSGTTFSINNGSASVTFVSISSQKVTATWAPGPSTGTFTISDSVDSATASVTVSNTLTTSGTNLTSDIASPAYCFDPNNEFTADAVGHTIQVSGGTGFTAGTYGINAVLVNSVLTNSQGTHNIAQLIAIGSTTTGAATGTASGGTWSWFMGAGGGGFGGTNGISWFRGAGAYMFDPDAPCSSALGSTSIAISGGTGATAGTYTVFSYTGSDTTGGQGTQNLIKFTVAPGSQGWDHVTWSMTGGTVIPTPVVNSAFAGPIRVMLIGDSITQRQTTTASALATQYPNASSISVSNQGASGSQTTDWLIGASSGYLTNAITAANAQGTTVVSIMLGTNDAMHSSMAQSTHTANIQAICNSLRANIPTLVSIVLEEQPALGSNISGYAADNTLLQSYFASYNTVTGATQGFSSATAATITNFAFFSANQQALQDGIHPTTAGTAEVNYTWLTSMASSITNTGPPTMTSAAINPNGTTITATFTSGNAPLQGTATAGWTVVVNGTADPVSLVSWSGTTGTLTLTNPALPGTATIAYDATMGNVTDSAGTPQALATITTEALTNNSVLGTITAAPTVTVAGFTESAGNITITYSVTLPTHGVTVSATSGGSPVTLGSTTNAPTYTVSYSNSSPPPTLVFMATNALYGSGNPTTTVPLFAVSSGGGGAAASHQIPRGRP